MLVEVRRLLRRVRQAATSTTSRFKIYQDSDAAYNDVIANSLDYIDDDPASDQLIDDKYKTDLPDRNAQRGRPASSRRSPSRRQGRPALEGPELRKAISMAIDRDPSSSRSSTAPAARHRLGLPGRGRLQGRRLWRVLQVRRGQGQGRLDEAGGFKGTITMTYNADAPNKDWTEATCNSIKNAARRRLHRGARRVDFATFRKQDRRTRR